MIYDDKTIIHIGFHKTGTTFIQKKIFSAFPDIFYRVPQARIGSHFSTSPLHYSEKEVQAFCDSEKSMTNAPINVFSCEALSSNIHGGDHLSAYKADRLYHHLPEAKVLIGIREQRSMIKSAYNQFLRAKGSYSIEEYLQNPKTNKFSFNHLQYDKIISYYKAVFGKEKILVLPYELLSSDPHKYLTTVFDFIGIDKSHILSEIEGQITERVNESLKPIQLQVKRYFNPFIVPGIPRLGTTFNFKVLKILFSISNKLLEKLPTKPIDERIQTRQLQIISDITGNRFVESNRKTSALIDINLADYGYKSS